MKRTVSLLLAAIFLSAVMLAVIPAANGSSLYSDKKTSADGNYEYVVNSDDSAKLTSYLGDSLKLSLPESIDGHPLTEIGAGAFYSSLIQSVTIPPSIKTIGWWAFFDCSELREVKLQSGVQQIKFGAFINCISLQNVEIPSTVYNIENDAFAVSVSSETEIDDTTEKRKISLQNYFNNNDFEITGYDGTCAKTYAEQSMLKFNSKGKISFGDLNADGSINNKDIVSLRNYSLGLEKLSTEQKLSADINCNGQVDDDDITQLMKYLEGRCAYQELLPFSGNYSKTNVYYAKKLYCAGDSVCRGTGTDLMGESFYSYANYITDLYGMKLKNDSKGGITLAKQKKKTGDEKSILERVKKMSGKYDLIIIEGGFNDLFQNIKKGKVTDISDKKGKYDEYTTAGAVESISYFLNKNYKNSYKLFVLGHRMVNEDKQDEYWSIIRRALEKWDIPYVDISEECDFCDLNSEIATDYFAYRSEWKKGDGIHPTKYAHSHIYGPIIDRKLNELAVRDSSITFKTKSVVLAMGERYNQIPSYRGSNYFVNYKWSSSEPDVAETDKFGNVKTKGVGTAYIKVEADDGSFCSYRIDVKNPPTCLYLSDTKLEMSVGETHKLNGILLKSQASYRNKFISTNPSVISVSIDGVVKARGSGKAKVICKSCSGILAECEVTVK